MLEKTLLAGSQGGRYGFLKVRRLNGHQLYPCRLWLLHRPLDTLSSSERAVLEMLGEQFARL